MTESRTPRLFSDFNAGKQPEDFTGGVADECILCSTEIFYCSLLMLLYPISCNHTYVTPFVLPSQYPNDLDNEICKSYIWLSKCFKA